MLQELDSIPVFFFLYSEDIKNIVSMLRQENFLYLVCIDVNDSFNKLNHLPSDIRFRTFLLDEDNKVLLKKQGGLFEYGHILHKLEEYDASTNILKKLYIIIVIR